MAIQLRCDACEFGCTLEDEVSAYDRASSHEAEYPTHNVILSTVPDDPGKVCEDRAR